MYIIVLVVCCKITFGPVHPIPWEEGPENVWDKTGYETKSEIVIVTVCAIFLVSEPAFLKKKKENNKIK